MNNEANIMDMFYRSETKPRIRERLISREQYLEFLEGQMEDNRVLCVQGVEGVGVTTTLALFAKRHGSHCASYFNNGWSRYLLNPKAIASSLQRQLEQANANVEDNDSEKNLTTWVYQLNKMTRGKDRYIFLTLAMIHPTCLHLCTKLLSKARKGDAIHPEKSALFTIY